MKVYEVTEERALLMNGVEALGLAFRQTHMRFCAMMRKPALFDHRVDRPRQIALGRVGFDDRERAFEWPCVGLQEFGREELRN